MYYDLFTGQSHPSLFSSDRFDRETRGSVWHNGTICVTSSIHRGPLPCVSRSRSPPLSYRSRCGWRFMPMAQAKYRNIQAPEPHGMRPDSSLLPSGTETAPEPEAEASRQPRDCLELATIVSRPSRLSPARNVCLRRATTV